MSQSDNEPSHAFSPSDASAALCVLSDLLRRSTIELATDLAERVDDSNINEFLFSAAYSEPAYLADDCVLPTRVNETDSHTVLRGWDARPVVEHLNLLAECTGCHATSVAKAIAGDDETARSWLAGIASGHHKDPDYHAVYEIRSFDLDKGPPMPNSDWMPDPSQALRHFRYRGAASNWQDAHELAGGTLGKVEMRFRGSSCFSSLRSDGPGEPLPPRNNPTLERMKSELSLDEQTAALAVAHRIHVAARYDKTHRSAFGVGKEAILDSVPPLHPSMVKMAMLASATPDTPVLKNALGALDDLIVDARHRNVREVRLDSNAKTTPLVPHKSSGLVR